MKIFQILFLIIFVVTTSTACSAGSRVVSKNFSKSVNNFSWNYFKTLDKNKNIFYSPYSISAALSMVANGATGKTQKEILAALGTKSVDSLNDDFKNFRKFAEKNYTNSTILKSADLILINQNFTSNGVNSKFEKIVKDAYQSEVKAADFSGNLNAEKSKIRNWVSKNTNNFIYGYQAEIDSETIVDILDVIYFKSKWANPFNESKTWKSDFTNKDGAKSKVKMMSKTFEDSMVYYSDEKYMSIVLPYQKNLAEMYLIWVANMSRISM